MRFLSYISNMTKNLDQFGLKSIVDIYDLFFIDIWGVIHNGIELHDSSIQVLENLSKSDKNTRLLTYKVILEKFNDKYSGLANNQKYLLKE